VTAPVKRVLVRGGGIAAPMAALAISRAYGRLGVEVIWHDTAETAPPLAALIAPPDLATFHKLLGIDEKALVCGAAATVNLGQQFAGWSGNDGAFLHAYGDAGTPYASLPFLQYWTRARARGLQVALEEFCLAAAAAKQGRVGEPAAGQALKRGWHLDAAGYARVLRAGCERSGVRIAVEEGQPADADLIVDAGGARTGDTVTESMNDGSPACDRILRGSGPVFEPLPPYSRVTAHRAGWLTLIPLADRTAAEFAFSSAHMSDEDARTALRAMTGGRITIADFAEPLRVGTCLRPWVDNIVAIGPSAVRTLPLDGAELLLLQLAIAQLILLWPIDRSDMQEAEIYNLEMGGTYARVQDFTAQHFRLNARIEPFWRDARAAPVSAELAAKIELFAARGLLAHCNHEAHVEDSWAMCMAGHGLIPRSFDPQAARVEERALMTEFQRQLGAIATAVRAMPSHSEALEQVRK